MIEPLYHLLTAWNVSVEYKPHSYGRDGEGRLVAFDYGDGPLYRSACA